MTALHVLFALLMTASFAVGVLSFITYVVATGIEHKHLKSDIQFFAKVALVLSAAVFLASLYAERWLP